MTGYVLLAREVFPDVCDLDIVNNNIKSANILIA